MKLHARSEFIIVAALIAVGHGLDLLTTYIVCPDLSREVGFLYLKLASLGHGTWGLLIAYKALFAAISIFAYRLIMRARRRFYPEQPRGSLRDFLHAAHSLGAVHRADGRWVMPSPRLTLLWIVYILIIGAATYAWALAIHNISGSPVWMDSLGRLIAALVAVFGFWGSAWYDYRSGCAEPLPGD